MQDLGGSLVEDMYRKSTTTAKYTGIITKMVLQMALEKLRNSETKVKYGFIKKNDLIKQGRPLKMFEIQKNDIRKFEFEAKKYGFQYTIIEDAKLGKLTALYKEEDTSRVEKALGDMLQKENMTLDKRLEQIRSKDTTIGNVGLDELVRSGNELSSISIKTKYLEEFDKVARKENMAYSTLAYKKEELEQIVKECKLNPRTIDVKMHETIINFKNGDIEKTEKALERMVEGGKKSLTKRLEEVRQRKEEIKETTRNVIKLVKKERSR